MFVGFFYSFSISKCFDLFDVTFLSKIFSLSSKSIFLTKAAMSVLLAKIPCANLAVKFLLLTY